MNEEAKKIYDSVDEVIAKLKIISDAGKGHYLVSSNSEYWLSNKAEMPSINDKSEDVDFI